MLTPDEQEVISDLAAVYNKIVTKVIGAGPSRPGDVQEIAFHIHGLQARVLSQAAAREYPDLYRLLGETLRDR